MDILSQKVLEIESGFKKSGLDYVSSEGNLTKNKSHVFANKTKEKLIYLVLSQNETELKSYRVSLKNWLKAEESGFVTDDIMKNLVVVRMFNITIPNEAKLQGNVFAEIELDKVTEYLEI